MKEIKLLKGTLQIGEKAIEEISALKGFKIRCSITKEEIKILLEKEFAGIDIPISLIGKELKIKNNLLKIKEFKILAGGMSIPLITVLPFLKNYDFLAMDLENKELIINLSRFISKNISYDVEKIEKGEGFLEIFIKDITMSL